MAYPKKLINDQGDIILAKQETHEAELLAAGYMLAPVEPAAPQSVGSLKPCAKCAELESQVSDLKAHLAADLEPQTGVCGQVEGGPAKRGRKPRAKG